MKKVCKFRLYPNEEQQELIEKTFGCVRFLYNRMLEDKVRHFEATGRKMHFSIAGYRNNYEWLKEVDRFALEYAASNLERVFEAYVEAPENGAPDFKSKKRERQSYITNLADIRVRSNERYIRLPKVGWVKLEDKEPVPTNGRIKLVKVVKQEDSSYFASVSFVLRDNISAKRM